MQDRVREAALVRAGWELVDAMERLGSGAAGKAFAASLEAARARGGGSRADHAGSAGE